MSSNETTAKPSSSQVDVSSDASTLGAGVGPTISQPGHIGSYRIVRRLGEGGMGVVFLAEQVHPRRQVALKIIRGECVSAEMLQRFQQEAAVLARLQHPGIAQIFESGTAAEAGRLDPFLVMEYVAGSSLTEYSTEKHLNTRERLELLVKVCAAVEHAHQKGVIHRDLKPGNILVDGAGQPKVLDFGVARATDPDWQVKTLATSAGQVVGTIPYMSPEQAEALPELLDTRSDVYALGVIGYELLAGRLPLDVRNRPIPEALRVILEDEPPSLGSVNRAYRGDLATIVAKALEKDRARRYQSAADLARDIERYLRDEPIQARPAGVWYQLDKFARRNRVLVGGVAAVFAALVLGVIGTSAALVYAQGQASQAITEKNNAQEAERKRQAEAAKALARSATLMAQHGKWLESVAEYDQAIELGHPDEIELQIGRLRCYLALNDSRAASETVSALSRRTDLGAYEGRVLLYRALLADAVGSEAGNPASLRHDALSKGLPAADDAYARSFDADTVPTAITLLEEAVQSDPYHWESHERLFVLYFASGRTEEAKIILGRLRLLEPQSAFVIGAHAFTQTLEGNSQGAEDSLVELERLGGEDIAAAMRMVFKHVGDFVRGQGTVASGDAKMIELMGNLLKTGAAMSRKTGFAASGPESTPGAQLLNYPLLGRILRHVGAYYAKDALFLRSAAADEIGELARILPESNVLTFHGMLLLNAGRVEEAERVLTEATKAPGVFDDTRTAYAGLADAQWQLGTADGRRNEEMLTKSRESVRALLRYAPLSELELGLAARTSFEDDPALALVFLEQWAKLNPKNTIMLNLRSIAEFRLGAYERSYLTTGEVLRLGGDNPKKSTAKFRATLLAKMRGEMDPDFDWLHAAKPEIVQFAATAKLSGDENDANAAPVAESVTGEADKLDGAWRSRLRVPDGPAEGYSLVAQVKSAGDRVMIELSEPGERETVRNIVARREGKRLVGWQTSTVVGKDASPWFGLIVDNERIDGIFPAGRLDLRRKLAEKPPSDLRNP